ncbi:hypothetical protein [Acinetobacter soli]|uniref:hypothetical protein n=1 Tax=Acinetobacter soli TaxID=487316 RepID=UPI000B4DA61E|nr:hypothetical protein [Acinetobacter soli]
MTKLIKKGSQVALEEIRIAMAELRNCQNEIQKGLTAQTYVDIANKKLSIAIHHMLNAEDWVDALNKESVE